MVCLGDWLHDGKWQSFKDFKETSQYRKTCSNFRFLLLWSLHSFKPILRVYICFLVSRACLFSLSWIHTNHNQAHQSDLPENKNRIPKFYTNAHVSPYCCFCFLFGMSKNLEVSLTVCPFIACGLSAANFC